MAEGFAIMAALGMRTQIEGGDDRSGAVQASGHRHGGGDRRTACDLLHPGGQLRAPGKRIAHDRAQLQPAKRRNDRNLADAEIGVEQARIALVQAQANRYADTAALFVALGGGWWNRPENENIADNTAKEN